METSSDSELELVYFNIKGRGEAIRLLLEVTGTAFKDSQPPNWQSYKQTLPFGQVPILNDGQFQLAQSKAILRYIARKTNTYGDNIKEASVIDMILDGEEEWRSKYSKVIYGENYEQNMVLYKESIPSHLRTFENVLKKNGTGFFVGNRLSVADIALFDILDIHTILKPDCLDNFQPLKSFKKKIEQSSKIDEYLKSNRRRQKVNANGKGQ